MVFKWISYALAIGVWNTVFIGIPIGIVNIVHAVLHQPLLTKSEIVLTFIIGYVTLFLLSVKIIDEE